jgi:hypothetical protein
MIFKKYGHIRTRYDDIKKRDRRWELEEFTRQMRKILKKIKDSHRKENMYICGCGK